MNKVTGGITFTGALAITLIALKLIGIIEWRWVWVLAPLWITALLWVLVLIICIIAAIIER